MKSTEKRITERTRLLALDEEISPERAPRPLSLKELVHECDIYILDDEGFCDARHEGKR